jgi:RHS repeat-associated protein
MAGISTVAPLKIANNYKFNGKELNHKEFSDGTGLDWYSYGMREYDPQIGRFFRVDPITDKFYELTPYQYASDNPIRNKDIDGLEGYDANLERWIEELGQGKITKEQYQLRIKSAAVGGLAGLALVGIVYSGGRALPLLSRAALWLSNPANQELVTTVGGLGVGLLDPTGQVDMPGTMDDAGRILGDMGRSVWKLNPLKRGLEIEKMLGGNLPKNFPVIDKFVEGEATSIKSIDLTAKSYNEGNGLFNTLKGYINKLEDFKGAQRGRTIIENSDITSKVLEVGIQPGKATLDQWEQISNAMKYAKEQDINLKLQFIQ